MASHILDEVEKICSHVTIIKSGKLLATGPVGSIISNDITIEIGSIEQEKLINYLRSIDELKIKNIHDGKIEFTAGEGFDASNLTVQLAKQNIQVTHLVVRKQRLEEEFLEITNQKN